MILVVIYHYRNADFLVLAERYTPEDLGFTPVGNPVVRTVMDAARSGPARPSVVLVLADQWRAQATGYAGDPNVQTPTLDRLHREGVSLTTAVSTCPVCTPARASLLTGQYPLTHGLFLNDVPLDPAAVTLGKVFRDAGYRTGYVGKWHVDGRGWNAFVPPERRQGFDFWRGYELSHDYNSSPYWADTGERRLWEGYDAEAQTRCAQEFVKSMSAGARGGDPFLLVLAWGPPHDPYDSAPARFRELYDPERIALRPNVPPNLAAQARADLAGYYAHCTALDTYLGELTSTLEECGLAEDTVFVFTSDHGDHVGSHGRWVKQTPWDESILVPFLVRYPRRVGRACREVRTPFGTPDIMPTLLGLCGLPIPKTVQGRDYSRMLAGEHDPQVEAVRGALTACYHVHGRYKRFGGDDFRAIRSERHTYARTLNGPWLLYDNDRDPYQFENLCGRTEHAALQAELDAELRRLLAEQRDEFLPGDVYLRRWGYEVDSRTGYSLQTMADLAGMRDSPSATRLASVLGVQSGG